MHGFDLYSNIFSDLQRRTVAGGNLQISTESSANDTPFASPLSTATSTQVPSTVRSSNALSSGSADHPYETELKGSEDMIAPSFVLLQLLCHSSWAVGMGLKSNSSSPFPSILRLPQTEIFDRTMKVLDRISPYETHKIGVIYVGRGQTNEAEILRNQFGSLRYQNFVERLGSPLVLKGVDTSEVFLGGLETDSGRDGAFTYHWSDQITQATFHVATLMPTTSADPNCRQKKLHIGNDFVCIIYNDSQSDFDLGTIKGQFSYVAIVVTPVDESHYLVALKAKDEVRPQPK